jgi:flagellar protein FliO/FliZ
MNNPIEPSQWLSMITSFILVIGLLVGTLWVLRRMSGRSLRTAGGRLAIVESLWLGPRQRLALVRIDERELLVAITQQQVTLLTVLPPDRPTDAHSDSETDRAVGADASGRDPVDAGNERPTSASATPDAAVTARFRQALRSLTGQAPKEGNQ